MCIFIYFEASVLDHPISVVVETFKSCTFEVFEMLSQKLEKHHKSFNMSYVTL